MSHNEPMFSNNPWKLQATKSVDSSPDDTVLLDRGWRKIEDETPEKPEDDGWDWCSRGSSHVDFAPGDIVPLQEGRFLGHGLHGGVFETRVENSTVAWKRKYTRIRLGSKERKEIEILKKLRHHHIIRLVGTYTKGPQLGLLLFPVAICDMASLLEDANMILNRSDRHTEFLPSAQDRVTKIIGNSEPDLVKDLLFSSMGCLTSAIAYLHENRIKHKDLKPANVLLEKDGKILLTDFGTSTDFSAATESVTEGGERGTPKYFAPEVAAYEQVGRSADIFSLGCIFFEIVLLGNGYSLDQLKEVRPFRDHSFHANLEPIKEFFKSAALERQSQFVLTEVRMMLRQQPRSRPEARHVQRTLQSLRALALQWGPRPWGISTLQPPLSFFSRLHQECCKPGSLDVISVDPKDIRSVKVHIGTIYKSQGSQSEYSFFVHPSETDNIEKVHVFMHPSSLEPQRVLAEHPFEFRAASCGLYALGCAIFFKEGTAWRDVDSTAFWQRSSVSLFHIVKLPGDGAAPSISATIELVPESALRFAPDSRKETAPARNTTDASTQTDTPPRTGASNDPDLDTVIDMDYILYNHTTQTSDNDDNDTNDEDEDTMPLKGPYQRRGPTTVQKELLRKNNFWPGQDPGDSSQRPRRPKRIEREGHWRV